MVKPKTETDHSTKIEKKITDHDNAKYITTQEINKLTAKKSEARLKQTNLVSKTDFHKKLIRFIENLPQIKQNIKKFKKKLNSLKER